MCTRVTCPECKKPTYSGCGRHVEAVLGDVPKAQRCRCHEAATQPSSSTSGGAGSLLDWLRGKRP
jgi:hypothetical protein